MQCLAASASRRSSQVPRAGILVVIAWALQPIFNVSSVPRLIGSVVEMKPLAGSRM